MLLELKLSDVCLYSTWIQFQSKHKCDKIIAIFVEKVAAYTENKPTQNVMGFGKENTGFFFLIDSYYEL